MNAAALFQAVESGDLGEVQRILEHNPNVEVDALRVDAFYGTCTPLIVAIRNSHKTIVELLLAHGAAVNGPVGASRTPLLHACESNRARSDIVSLLLEHGADVDAMTARITWTPLTIACRSNRNFDVVQLLINAGADVNGSGGRIAPLHRAALYGNTEAVELLIQSGADVNKLSSRGYGLPAGSTPLLFASFRHSLDCINSLLAAGADPNIANSEGQTPLHPAAWISIDAVNALLDAGCDPLHQDNNGRTPLQYKFLLVLQSIEEGDPEPRITTALVAAGDRSWRCVLTPCPGLEAAMLSVWQAAPDELHELLKRLENPPQTLIELVPRLSEETKKVVQEVLRVLHRHFAGFSHLKEDLLNSIFGLGTV